MNQSSTATTYIEIEQYDDSSRLDSCCYRNREIEQRDYLLSSKSSSTAISNGRINIFPRYNRYSSYSTSTSELHSKTGSTYKQFLLLLNTNLLHALYWVKNNLTIRTLSKNDVLEWVFPYVIKSKGDHFETLYDFIIRIGDSKSILEYAINKHREGESIRYLQIASSIIGEYKRDALKTLINLFEQDLPEAEYFVSTACFLRELDENERKKLLEIVMKSSRQETRLALVFSLEYSNFAFRTEMLRSFLNDCSIDVQEAANSILKE